MIKKKQPILIRIVLFPFHFIYKILLGICLIYSYLNDFIKSIIYHNNIDTMSGIAFEQFVKKLLQQNHFHHVELTKASNDYGVDILAMKNYTLYAIQCKKYKSKVGIEAVRQAATGCIYYDQDIPVVITNSTFSSQAIKLASTLDVELWDAKVLQQLMKKSSVIKKRKYILFFFLFLLGLFLMYIIFL